MDDCDLLFEWANYPMVRQNFFSTKAITYDEHVNWFRNIMERKDCVEYLFNKLGIGYNILSLFL